jgi:hypothetical protein
MLRSFGLEAQRGDRDLAPLTFTQASVHEDPESPLRPHTGQPWKGSGRAASGVESTPDGAGWMHAEQHLEYRRHPRVGESLSWTRRPGRAWENQGSSAHLSFAEEITEYRDANDEVVVVSMIVRVRREAGSGSS